MSNYHAMSILTYTYTVHVSFLSIDGYPDISFCAALIVIQAACQHLIYAAPWSESSFLLTYTEAEALHLRF